MAQLFDVMHYNELVNVDAGCFRISGLYIKIKLHFFLNNSNVVNNDLTKSDRLNSN